MFVALQSPTHVHIDLTTLNGIGDRFHVLEENLGTGRIQFVPDYETQKLYWIDTNLNRIMFTDFHDMETFVFMSKVLHPSSIAIVNNDLFWSQLHSPLLSWTHKSNLGSTKNSEIWLPTNFTTFSLPSRLPLLSSVRHINMNHPCQRDNGGCSDICITKDKFTATCLCSSGRVFSDPSNRTCIKVSDCEFMCLSGQCLAISHRCNGYSDCSDNSDEIDCDSIVGVKLEKSECAINQFACHDGTHCVRKSEHCDKKNDCADRSDEEFCEYFSEYLVLELNLF